MWVEHCIYRETCQSLAKKYIFDTLPTSLPVWECIMSREFRERERERERERKRERERERERQLCCKGKCTKRCLSLLKGAITLLEHLPKRQLKKIG